MALFVLDSLPRPLQTNEVNRWSKGTTSVLFLCFGLHIGRTAELDELALRYGYLMTRHWLTVDSKRQVERANFYDGGLEARQKLGELATDMRSAEEKLEQVRALYKSLFRTNSSEGLEKLVQLLEQCERTENQNAKRVHQILQELGAHLAGERFQPDPVSEADLAPSWNPATDLDQNRRPTRILFGSTGRVGDERTLPLCFDFGSGPFGAFISMKSSNELAVSEAVKTQTDPAWGWMKARRSGYYYWAGVYNNQNTYLAPWFLKAHQQEDDIWMKLADGKVMHGSEWGQVNIWNPDVRSYIQQYCQAQGETLRNDRFLVCYDYTAEPHPFGSQPPQPSGLPQYSGYNDSARQSFRSYLKQKFGTLAKLNRSWNAHYADFEAIEPPPDPYVSPPAKATPLLYEFHRWRCDSHAEFWRLAYDGYRQADKTKPIVANAGMFMGGWPVEGLDPWQLQKAGVADWIDMHMNNFWPNLPEQIYLYSLCRLSGKVPVQFEYIWTFPRTGPVDDSSESDFRATCEASVWRNLVWGKKAMVFFDFYYDWPAYHNAFFDRDAGYSILRPSACVVPVTKRKALRFNQILMKTEVATPRMVVLDPVTSEMNSPPLHPNQSFGYHTAVAGKDVHDLLFPRNYPFFYVPEQAVLDGYDLRQHKVVILPQAPYLPEKLTTELLSWVYQGGTLISIGLPGLWNPYGAEDMRLINGIFGPSSVTDRGKWNWEWKISKALPSVLWKVQATNGLAAAASASYGEGRVLVSAGNFNSPELRKQFFSALDEVFAEGPVTCGTNAFELVVRENKRGDRFLCVLNPHTREIREDEINLAGRFAHCLDLGIGSGVPIRAEVTARQTRFRLRLHPGESTVISLN